MVDAASVTSVLSYLPQIMSNLKQQLYICSLNVSLEQVGLPFDRLALDFFCFLGRNVSLHHGVLLLIDLGSVNPSLLSLYYNITSSV